MNKKVLEQLASTLKLDVELLTKSLSSENEDAKLELPKFYTETDITTIKTNLGKEKYDEGASASREMTLKDLSDLVGFDERIKDKEAFVKAFKDKVLADASIEPNKKVEELQASIEKLQGVVSDKDKAYSDLEASYKQKETRFKAESLFPTMPEHLGLNKSEGVDLFFMSHEIKEDGIYKNGQKLKDNVEKPLGIEDAVKGFISEKGWDKAPTPRGRGGNPVANGQGAKPSSLEEFETLAKERGLNVGSQEYNALLREVNRKDD